METLTRYHSLLNCYGLSAQMKPTILQMGTLEREQRKESTLNRRRFPNLTTTVVYNDPTITRHCKKEPWTPSAFPTLRAEEVTRRGPISCVGTGSTPLTVDFGTVRGCRTIHYPDPRRPTSSALSQSLPSKRCSPWCAHGFPSSVYFRPPFLAVTFGAIISHSLWILWSKYWCARVFQEAYLLWWWVSSRFGWDTCGRYRVTCRDAFWKMMEWMGCHFLIIAAFLIKYTDTTCNTGFDNVRCSIRLLSFNKWNPYTNHPSNPSKPLLSSLLPII